VFPGMTLLRIMTFLINFVMEIRLRFRVMSLANFVDGIVLVSFGIRDSGRQWTLVKSCAQIDADTAVVRYSHGDSCVNLSRKTPLRKPISGKKITSTKAQAEERL